METTTKTAAIAASAAIACAIIAGFASIRAGSSSVEARTAAKAATNLIRTIYDNGHITQSGVVGARMVVRLNGSNNAGPVVQPIDMERLVELCGDSDGCTLTLGASGFQVKSSTGYPSGVTIMGAPCKFFYDKLSRSWSLSQSCVVISAIYKENKAGTGFEFGSYYQNYSYANAFGVDDSFEHGKDSDGEPLHIMSFQGACFLSESAPDTTRSGAHLLPDNASDLSTGRGLFLFASSPKWDNTGAYPDNWPETNSARQCILIVED